MNPQGVVLLNVVAAWDICGVQVAGVPKYAGSGSPKVNDPGTKLPRPEAVVGVKARD